MRTDLSQGFLDAVAIGDCDRYCVIHINGVPKYFAKTALQIDSENIAIPAVSKWGRKTVGTDLNASVNNISIPAVDRSVSLINNDEYGWIGREFARKTQEGKRIDFRVIANGEDILEDSLVIKEPISYRQGDPEIVISCVSAMVSRDPLVGSFDPLTQAYSSVSVGSIGNAIGTFREDISDPHCKVRATALSGTSTIVCDRDLVDAGFEVTGGTITVDYEDVTYIAISGVDRDTFQLSSNLTKTHLAGQHVCLLGGTYYYDYGPGPVDVVGSLMVKGEDGTYSPYGGEYEISNGARVLLVFTGFLPYRKKAGTVESSITKSWNASQFDNLFPSNLTVSGDSFYWKNSIKAGNLAARLQNIYATLPAEAVFSRGTTTINFSYYGNPVTVRTTSTQTRGVSGFDLYYDSYSSGNYIYGDDGDHKILAGSSQQFAAMRAFSVAAPASSTFVSGSVRVRIHTGYGQGSTTPGVGIWSYASGSIGGSTRTFGSSSSTSFDINVDSTYSCSSLSTINNTTLRAYIKNNTSNTDRPLPMQCIYVTEVLASATFDTTYGNAIRGYGTVRIFGVNYSGSRNITISTSDYAKYLDSSVLLYVESDYSKPDLLIGSIGSISSTLYYMADAPGYPQRVVYDAENSTVKIGEEGSDVNPVDLIANLMLRKGGQLRIDDTASQAAKDYYDANGYLMNGYIEGSTRTNAAVLEVMKEAAAMVFDRAGNVVIKRRVLPVDASSELTIFRGEYVKNGISINHQSDDDCTNRITIRYNADAGLNYASSYSAENDISVASIGSREEIAIDFPHIDLQSFAEHSASYWLERNTLPFRVAEVQLFADKGQIIEYGDYITVSTAFSRIGEIFGEVVQIAVDYASKSSPTIYTITMTSGGTTNEPEYLWLEDETVYGYEYLNLHPTTLVSDTFFRPDTAVIFRTLKPAETLYTGLTGYFNTLKPAETLYTGLTGYFNTLYPAETFYFPEFQAVPSISLHADTSYNADGAALLLSLVQGTETTYKKDVSVLPLSVVQTNETLYSGDTPTYSFTAFQSNEVLYAPDTPVLFRTLVPQETLYSGDTPTYSFTVLPSNETLYSGDTPTYSFTAFQSNEVLYAPDTPVLFRTLVPQETLYNGSDVLFRTLVPQETLCNGDTPTYSFTVLPSNESFFVNDDEVFLNTIKPSDILVPVDGTVTFAATNAWGEFAWAEAGHYWGKLP